MKAKAHVCASAAAGAAVWGSTGSAAMAVSCLASGILLDADHLLDFYLLAGEPFSVKGFVSWCDELRWEKIYLALHSYELYVLLVLAARLFPGEILYGVLLGMGLHLFMDQTGNKPLNKWFYFMTFRYRSGFAKSALTAGGICSGGRSGGAG
ncbi:MAG: hypothetical protein HY550_02900 [Elusimicrobia bacterium]|nr:hypothetical protein [Elusimicrobiota bacterium]